MYGSANLQLLSAARLPAIIDLSMIQTLFGSLDEEQKPSFLDRMKEAVTRTRELGLDGL